MNIETRRDMHHTTRFDIHLAEGIVNQACLQSVTIKIFDFLLQIRIWSKKSKILIVTDSKTYSRRIERWIHERFDTHHTTLFEPCMKGSFYQACLQSVTSRSKLLLQTNLKKKSKINRNNSKTYSRRIERWIWKNRKMNMKDWQHHTTRFEPCWRDRHQACLQSVTSRSKLLLQTNLKKKSKINRNNSKTYSRRIERWIWKIDSITRRVSNLAEGIVIRHVYNLLHQDQNSYFKRIWRRSQRSIVTIQKPIHEE